MILEIMENLPEDIITHIKNYTRHPLAEIVRDSTIYEFINHLGTDQAEQADESCSERSAFDQGRRDAAGHKVFYKPNIMRGIVNPDVFEMQVWLTPKEIDDFRIGFLHQRTHYLKRLEGDNPNTRNMNRVRWDCSPI